MRATEWVATTTPVRFERPIRSDGPVTRDESPPAASSPSNSRNRGFFTVSQPLHQPGRLNGIGADSGHLMQWSGWAIVGVGALMLGIAGVKSVLTVVAVIAAIILGL